MAGVKRRSMAKLCLALGLFILAGVFRQFDRAASPLPSAVFFLLTNLIYIGLAMAWGFSISHRILHRGVRRYLMLGCAMAVLWLFLRAVKYRFFEAGEINRYLWYLYYVPQVLAPLFSLFAALQMGRREDEAFSGWWHLMYLPAALLIGGVLTNNLHHQAFRPALGAETLEAAYIHGWVYYLAMAWSVALLLATGVMVYRKCRICESRRLAWVPFLAFGGGFALCALSFANLYTLHKTPECLCLTFAAFWESCLQVGLVPTNGYYRYFFAESTAAAQIVDSQGRTRYRAQSAPVLTRQQLREAKRADSGRARLLGGGYFENQPNSGAAFGGQRAAFGGKRADSGRERAEAPARGDRGEEPAHGRDAPACRAAAPSNQSAAGRRNRAEPETRLPAGRIRQAPGQPRADLRKEGDRAGGGADALYPGIADLSDAIRRCLRAASGGKRQRRQPGRADGL